MKQGPFPPAGLCCPRPSSGTTTPSDSLVAACHFPTLAGYRQALLPEPRRLGATEGLSSSHDNLPTVPRPLRRRVPWHPLQAPRCRPWPSPSEYRLGSLLAACAVILNDAAGFASCCGPVGCPPRTGGGLPPPRHRDLARRRECCYRGPWRLPGPDSHRLAAVSLSLGYVVVPSFRYSSAPELLDAHSAGIAGGGVRAAGRPSSGRPRGRRGRRPAPPGPGSRAAAGGPAGTPRALDATRWRRGIGRVAATTAAPRPGAGARTRRRHRRRGRSMTPQQGSHRVDRYLPGRVWEGGPCRDAFWTTAENPAGCPRPPFRGLGR